MCIEERLLVEPMEAIRTKIAQKTMSDPNMLFKFLINQPIITHCDSRSETSLEGTCKKNTCADYFNMCMTCHICILTSIQRDIEKVNFRGVNKTKITGFIPEV